MADSVSSGNSGDREAPLAGAGGAPVLAAKTGPGTSCIPAGGWGTLAGMLPGTILAETDLARALGVTDRSIRRQVRRGELPPGVPLGGRRVWLCGKVLAYLDARLERAAVAAERETARIGRI